MENYNRICSNPECAVFRTFLLEPGGGKDVGERNPHPGCHCGLIYFT